jgi:hypothetical protein
MLIIVNDTTHIDIEDKYLAYSPYLSSAMETGRKISGSDHIYMDIEDITLLENYLSFLRGEDFEMDHNDGIFFDFMGHENNMKYPLHYWRLKLKSKWIRDNFYRLNLHERDNGLIGLVEVPIINDHEMTFSTTAYGTTLDIDTERNGVVVAGGAAVNAAGFVDHCSDVDLFSIDKEKSLTFFRQDMEGRGTEDMRLSRSRPRGTEYTIDILRNSYARSGYFGSASKITLIRRLYLCPAEVVHGFDLDICQFVIVYKNSVPTIYATEIGLYAAKTQEQWYDPEMVSTSYIERLAKYQRRGIKLRLPLISKMDLSTYITVRGKRMTPSIMIKSIGHYQSQRDCKQEIADRGIPNDIGTILILVGLFGESRTHIVRALLNPVIRDWQEYDQELKGITDAWSLPWITIDPMQQAVLSGIMYPIPRDDIQELYRQSPLHKDYSGDYTGGLPSTENKYYRRPKNAPFRSPPSSPRGGDEDSSDSDNLPFIL